MNSKLFKNWRPVDPDGESLDFITEMWDFIQAKKTINIFIYPPMQNQISQKFFAKYNQTECELTDSDTGIKYLIMPPLSTKLATWSKRSRVIDAKIIYRKKKAIATIAHNEDMINEVMIIAIDGGPFLDSN